MRILNLLRRPPTSARDRVVHLSSVVKILFSQILICSFLFNSVAVLCIHGQTVPREDKKADITREKLKINQKSPQRNTINIFRKQVMKTGKQTRFTGSFDLPPGAAAPFIMQIDNGNPDGTGRVMDGMVKINGEIVVSSGSLNPLQPGLTLKLLSLNSTNTIEVEFFSLLQNTSLTITIVANLRTPSNPPVISSFSPDRGIPGTSVILSGTNLIPSVVSDTAETVVTFAGKNNSRIRAQITFSSPTQMRVNVPNGALTGPIILTNNNGQAISPMNFTVEPTDDFVVIVSPTTVNAVQRATGIVVVAVASVRNDFTQLADLSASGLPAGVTAAFDPSQITAGTTSTLMVNLSKADLLPGSYPFTVSGTAVIDGHQITRSASATLNVIDAGKTTLSGRVLSTEKEPVIGATVSLDGQSAVTDAAGIFLLSGITAGSDRPVRVDGRTANAPGRRYPDITEPATVIAGQANTVPFTFYLPAIDAQYEVPVIPNQTTTAKNPRLPDLKMMIPPNSNLRNRDGTAVSTVSITPLPVDRTPAPLPSNVAAAIVYTSQPGGAITDVPIPVVYPNSTGLSPGTSNIPLYAFDHDTVVWYIYGRGRVSNDGRTIEPEINPGTGQPYGLRDFSWHFPLASSDGNEGGDGCGAGGGAAGGGGWGDSESDSDCGAGKNRNNSGGNNGSNNSPCSSNPVDLSTGAKHEEATDISFGGGRGELELTRIYTSDLAQSCNTCVFGRGFTHNYDIRLSGTFSNGGAGRLITPGNITGKLFGFVRVETDGSLLFTNTINRGFIGDELRKRTDGTFEFRYKDHRVMLFNSSGRLTSLRDSNGNAITFTYSGSNLTQITDAVGRSITLTYSSGRITTATDPLNRTWTYAYSGNQLIQVADPLLHSTQYNYVIGGRLSSVIDPRGNTVKQITYNNSGRVTRQDFADGGFETYSYALSGMDVTETTVTDALGRVTKERFNPLGYVIERTDEFGLVTKIQRDLQTNLILSTVGSCGCTENLRSYDERGNVTQVTDRTGNITRYEYEPVFNKVSKMTDRLNRVTEFSYDSRGNLISIKDPLNHIYTLAYDNNGLLTSVTDPLNHAVSMVYDASGNVIERHDALNNTTSMEYDAIGRLKAVIDPLLRRVSMNYDDTDRIISLIDSANATTSFNYDNGDNLLGVVNGLGKQWNYAYDSKNRRVSETDPLGNKIRYAFDKADQLTKIQSPSGRQMAFEYDERGQQEAAVDGLGGRTSYEYDREGNLTTLTDQRNNTTTFTYDQLYRVTGIRDPLGNPTQVTYDAEGNRTGKIDRLSRQTAYSYDGLNRPTHIAYADSAVDYTYDAANRLTRIDDTQSGALQWNYDDAGRVISAVMPVGTVGYGYNTASQVTAMTAANRPAVNYAYDTAGRLSTISQGSETFTYSYDAISRLAGLQRPNGVSTGYEYDNANRLSRLSHKNSVNQFIEDLKYTYNPDSEIESINSLANAPNLPAAKTVDPADAANRIHQFGSTLNQFNAEGETTSQTTQQGTVNYTWDARGRMTQAALPGGQTVSYNYDALGRRAGRSSGGASTGFLYDGDDVVLDSNSDGSTVDYLNGQSIDDKLRQASSTTGTNYFLQDHLGSTVALTDPSGNLSARINYEPFGESPGSALTRYDYTGRERDSATGLLYYRARWMDPKQGRFLTEDPIGFRGENNFYSYVGDNALNYKDPHGLFIFVPYLINIGRGAIVGGLVSAAASIALGERDYRKVLASGLSGAVSGGLNSAGLGPGASAAIGSALNEYLNEKIDCQKLNPNKILLSAVLGGGTGKALDKVKIIGSSSSGKIGAAVGATANDFSKEVASQIVDTIVKAPLFPESPPEHR